MRIPPSSEYIDVINQLLKTQSLRINKHFKDKQEKKSSSRIKLEEVIQKWDAIKKYISTWILPEIEMNLIENNRYIINYSEGNNENSSAKYFKIIIKNKVTNNTNFFLLNYNYRDIIIKIKEINSADDSIYQTYTFSWEKFTKGRFRQLFFEYFQEIIITDTLPKRKNKKENLELSFTKQNHYITLLNTEIERMKKIAERNKQMMIEANAKKYTAKERKKLKNEKDNLEINKKIEYL